MPSSMPVPAKPRPYRRLVTSSLHARFVHAAALSLVWHLCLAGLVEYWWTSLSVSALIRVVLFLGFKALCLCWTSFFVFLLQIATLRIGRRCTPSNWASIKTTALSYSTYATFFWYLLSAVWFSQVLVFTSPTTRDLSWVIYGGYSGPDTLNERPLYLQAFMLVLATIHAVLHICYDSSSLLVYLDPEKQTPQPHTTSDRMLARLPRLLTTAAVASAAASVMTPLLYNGLFRSIAWSWQVFWARLFANVSRSDQHPPGSFYIGRIWFYAAWIGLLLSITWQLNIILFKIYMLQEPTRNAAPLSSQSKDPNGSLLHGLKSKKELTKTFAVWELDLIAKKFPQRRKDIFGDFERPMQGPILTSMINAALEVLASIPARINELNSAPMSSAALNDAPTAASSNKDVQKLPRLFPDSIATKNPIYSKPSTTHDMLQRAADFIAAEAKTLGSSPNAWTPSPERTRQLAIEYSSPAIKDIQRRAQEVQQTPLGRYLLASPIRLIKSGILGTPLGNPALPFLASSSVTTFLVASLSEDSFGNAVGCVPSAVQQLTGTILAIESFVLKHTNGNYDRVGVVSESDAKELKDIATVHEKLKVDLTSLLTKFRHFLIDVGLSVHQLQEAEGAAVERQLFTTIAPLAAGAPVAEIQAGRANRPNGVAGANDGGRGNRPEMEEVRQDKGKGRVGSRQPQKEEEAAKQINQPQRRHSRQDPEPRQADHNRPGRLFPQLDEGSSYQASLRARKQSNSHRLQATGWQNPLAAGNAVEKAENPFGARDFNSLPAGGLQRRRAV